MTLGILTTITNPWDREDAWIQALECYCELADEVIVVNGGEPIGDLFVNSKIREVFLEWSQEWNWIELPRHLNYGLSFLKTDWCLKLDIDQLIHERHFKELRQRLADCPQDYHTATMQKMSFTYGKKYYQKGEVITCLRNLSHIRFGKDKEQVTDLCFPIWQTGTEVVYQDRSTKSNPIYELPIGHKLTQFKTRVKYFNYDYFFKTQEFTRKEFWRASQAYHRYFNSWPFGDSEENAFKAFLNLAKGRHDKAPYREDENTHPKWMKEAVKNLTLEQCGYNLWGMG